MALTHRAVQWIEQMGRQPIIAIVALTGLSLGPRAAEPIQQKSGASPSNKDSGQRTPHPDSVNAKGTFGSIAMAFPIAPQRPTRTYIRQRTER